MPTYEYRCDNGHTFELIQRMNDKPATKCPQCGAKASRVISGGQGVIFKGSGFYITDYGKDGKGPRKDADAAPAPKVETPAPAAETKSEPKPAATPAKKTDAP